MTNKALVTGATGLLGRQVVQAFERAEWEVVGTGFARAKPPTILRVDLGAEAEVAKALGETKYVIPRRILTHTEADVYEEVKTTGSRSLRCKQIPRQMRLRS